MVGLQVTPVWPGRVPVPGLAGSRYTCQREVAREAMQGARPLPAAPGVLCSKSKGIQQDHLREL